MKIAGLSKILQEKDKLGQKLAGLRSRKKFYKIWLLPDLVICRKKVGDKILKYLVQKKKKKKPVKIPQLNSLALWKETIRATVFLVKTIV